LRPEFGKGRRCFLIRPYVAIYEPTPAIVMILRIVHGARDLPTLLADLR
jgi:plasmid stabilization system protein ParE